MYRLPLEVLIATILLVTIAGGYIPDPLRNKFKTKGLHIIYYT